MLSLVTDLIIETPTIQCQFRYDVSPSLAQRCPIGCLVNMKQMTTLSESITSLGLTVSPAQLDQLARYRDLLAASSREFNLTSLRDPKSIERRHVIESLAFSNWLDQRGHLQGTLRVLDIGTGAGLPGIPMKIAWPALEVALLESVGKKCRFLELACRELQLHGVEVIEGRAEDFGRNPDHRETYDLVVARAVAPLPVLLEYALPFLRVEGWLAAPKGSAAQAELDTSQAALKALGGRIDDAAPFRPPDSLRQTVVLVQKTATTPERFPRRSGIPSKRPI
jgi:16S rRNA (guanine527-N7)-methyltransferase